MSIDQNSLDNKTYTSLWFIIDNRHSLYGLVDINSSSTSPQITWDSTSITEQLLIAKSVLSLPVVLWLPHFQCIYRFACWQITVTHYHYLPAELSIIALRNVNSWVVFCENRKGILGHDRGLLEKIEEHYEGEAIQVVRFVLQGESELPNLQYIGIQFIHLSV